MIFVTIGLHKYQFNRLSDWIERAIREKVLKDQIFYQHGASRALTHKLVKCQPGISFKEYLANLNKCSFAIVHASIGALTELNETKKPFIMVPRDPKLQEAADDNQTATARMLESEFGVEIAWTYEDFVRLIKKGGVKLPKIRSEKKKLISYLDAVVKSL